MRNSDPPSPSPVQNGADADLRAPPEAHPLLPAADVAPGDPNLPESFGGGWGRDAATEAFGRPEARGEKPRQKPPPKKKAPDKGDGEEEDDSDVGGEKQQKKKDEDKKPEEDEDQKKKEEDEDKEPGKPPLYKRPWFIIVAIILLILIIVGGILWWLHKRQYVSTDDAYIDGNVTEISPQVSAIVQARFIDDNMLVKKGELLIELDPTDFNVAVQRAQANAEASQGRLGQAQTQVGAADATVAQNQAEIDAAQVQLDNASEDLKRYQDVDPRARTQQQLDNAIAAQRNAEAQLAQAKARKSTAQANLKAAQAAVKAAQGDLDSALASVRQAQVNLTYCKIFAPSDGWVTSRTVEAGMYVTPGQAMFSLVSPDIWVTANFKETQLTHMQVGQSVTIKVDAFPGKKYTGHVQSIQAGSGARFSVLPAENATGNFVKIVQRVPVKILIDPGPNTDDSHLLSPGLSVEPEVKVR